MAPIFLKTTLLVLLVSSGFQCRRNNDNSSHVLTGRLVVDDPCGQFAIQVLDGQIDPAKVVASWTDTDNDSVYQNTFRVSGIRDVCSFAAYTISKGDLFQFELDPNPSTVPCNTCAIRTQLALPPVSNAVKNVKKIVGQQ
jgi:hypothetical protein